MKKQISSELKGKVALEAIRSLRSVNDIASEYGVYPSQVGQWKKQYIAASAIVFESRLNSKEEQERTSLLSSLYEKIGQLEVERDFLKKKWRQMDAK